jgi:hypothetical protein
LAQFHDSPDGFMPGYNREFGLETELTGTLVNVSAANPRHLYFNQNRPWLDFRNRKFTYLIRLVIFHDHRGTASGG